MIDRIHRSGRHSAVALALAGLMSSGPVQAVEAEPTARLKSLAETVATLEEPAPPAIGDAGQPASEAYEPIGEGMASYYGHELAGNRTASGERFNPQALTAAHRSLPMGTRIRVTNQANGRSVVVRVNDRGPFARGRIIDVSLAAAREIAMVRTGTARVSLEIVRVA
jgi:peptidoglycan lytic transglycosylase